MPGLRGHSLKQQMTPNDKDDKLLDDVNQKWVGTGDRFVRVIQSKVKKNAANDNSSSKLNYSN